ncbi:MAG: hypothetical protein ACREBS_07060 [Nitrososphaerales archaeon]
MTRKEKDPVEEEAKEFHTRVKKVKHDEPELRLYAGLISGLLEEGRWTFICSEHLEGRYRDETELKQHFLSGQEGHQHRHNY